MSLEAHLLAPPDEEFEVTGRGLQRRFWARGLSGLNWRDAFYPLVSLHLRPAGSAVTDAELELVLEYRSEADDPLVLCIRLVPRAPAGTCSPDSLDALIARLAAEPGLFAPLLTLDLGDALAPGTICREVGPGLLAADVARPTASAPLLRLAQRFRTRLAV